LEEFGDYHCGEVFLWGIHDKVLKKLVLRGNDASYPENTYDQTIDLLLHGRLGNFNENGNDIVFPSISLIRYNPYLFNSRAIFGSKVISHSINRV
jgi:hypothetical protein